MRVLVPPIKCQGIKTKLVPLILRAVDRDPDAVWVEPFLGSGVVALNVAPKRAILADTNPHLIAFYKAVQDGLIDGRIVRAFLKSEGQALAIKGGDHYYRIRERFNKTGSPLDFLFLNRSCFNGLIRFNKKGGFNVPFGHKPQRFSKAYITKIANQVEFVRAALRTLKWEFVCQDFKATLSNLSGRDFVYCDPPYVGRHVDYYDSWDEDSERILHDRLKSGGHRFMLSTWHSNEHRTNEFLQTLWSEFSVLTREHFYHVGALETNRKPMLEALVTNYAPATPYEIPEQTAEQLFLLERGGQYIVEVG